MNYKINNNINIKSHNAAKSIKQTNKFLLNYITHLPSNYTVLDYGCGKLRYTLPLCDTVETVFAIDSSEQLARIQNIDGVKTTVLSFEDKYPNLKIYELSKNEWMNRHYDFILCSNVLSAIPYRKERVKVLKNIRNVLKPNGTALITVQYRNSYFSDYENRSTAIPYYDGWIINNKGNYSFYGLVIPEKLKKLCSEAKLIIENTQLKDGSCYIFVKRG